MLGIRTIKSALVPKAPLRLTVAWPHPRRNPRRRRSRKKSRQQGPTPSAAKTHTPSAKNKHVGAKLQPPAHTPRPSRARAHIRRLPHACTHTPPRKHTDTNTGASICAQNHIHAHRHVGMSTDTHAPAHAQHHLQYDNVWNRWGNHHRQDRMNHHRCTRHARTETP